MAEIWLNDHEWTIRDRQVKMLGFEADYLAEDPNGEGYVVSVKWSVRGNRQGLKRTDTLRKAIAEAWLCKETYSLKFMVLTNHIPEDGVGRDAYQIALSSGLFDRVELIS